MRATRALPVRAEVVQMLLDAEVQREQIEDRVSEVLAHFRQVTEDGRDLMANQAAVASLDEVEQEVLARESQFANFLDIACLQSETLEVMLEELTLLRDMTEIDHSSENRSPAAERLMTSIDEAVQKRRVIDQKLNHFGSSQTQTESESGFDAIVS